MCEKEGCERTAKRIFETTINKEYLCNLCCTKLVEDLLDARQKLSGWFDFSHAIEWLSMEDLVNSEEYAKIMAP